MPISSPQGPEDLGIIPERLHVAQRLIDLWSQSAEVTATAFVVGRRVGMCEVAVAGSRSPDSATPTIGRDAPFLAASLTKPVTAVATMILVERGLFTLVDRVASLIPEFGQNGKENVQVRHLLTHTSGLPDQLPNNESLRARHAGLAEFVDETNQQSLLFNPGTAVRYQSMGFTMLGELVRRLTGRPLPEFLQDEVFTPLGMSQTSLGSRRDRRERETFVRIDSAAQATDWHWNSPYWRGLGAPWGGLITTAADYGRFLQMMLGGGSFGDQRVLSPATVQAMTTNQLLAFGEVPEEDRRLRPWGLGWRLHWPGTSAHFGDLLGPASFGHWGATGTLAWADSERDAFAVILTTQPQGDQGLYLARLSNVLASAFA